MLQAPGGDPEAGPQAKAITCRLQGKVGHLLLDEGGINFNVANDAPGACSSACLGPCSSPQSLFFPWKHLVGATVSPSKPAAVQFWMCKPKVSKAGPINRTQYMLDKSGWFECNSPEEASQIVSTVQRTASWGGKSSPRKVVAIVNPVSGTGKSEHTFHHHVLPVLRDAAGLSVDVHVTHSRGHATRIIQELKLQEVDVLVFNGGDGTFWEGLQGLMRRPDWETVCKIPMCHVPAGSGNGLAASFGCWDPTTAAFSVCKSATRPLDVASVLQPPNSRYYMVLSVAYGLMANLDIGTEHLRWMGELRFSYGGLKGILGGHTWPVRAALCPADQPHDQDHYDHGARQGTGNSGPPAATKGGSVQGSGILRAPLEQGLLRDGAAGNDMATALLAGRSNSSSLHHASCTVAAPGAGGAMGGAGGGMGREQQAGSPGDGKTRQSSGPSHFLSDYPPGPPLPLLEQFGPSLPSSLPRSEDQLPPGWTLLPDQVCEQMQYFMVLNTTHLALGAHMNPKSSCEDGTFELMHVSGQTSLSGKMNGLKVLTGIEDGSLVEVECMKSHKVRAVVVEPQAGDTTWLVVDGEEVPRDRSLFIEVHPRLLTALVSPDLARS